MKFHTIHAKPLISVLVVFFFPVVCFGVLTFTFNQVGSDIVCQAQGSLDLSRAALISAGQSVVQSETQGIFPIVSVGSGPYDQYIYPTAVVTGPAAIGTGDFHASATFTTGETIGLIWSSNTLEVEVLLPPNYVSPLQISASATWTETTYADLGLDPTGSPYIFTVPIGGGGNKRQLPTTDAIVVIMNTQQNNPTE